MNFKIEQKHIDSIRGLIVKAIKCELTIEELNNAWDMGWNSNDYLSDIYDNLESSVEHYPGYFLKKGINLSKWHRMAEFVLLQIDSDLIQLISVKDTKELVKMRESKFMLAMQS